MGVESIAESKWAADIYEATVCPEIQSFKSGLRPRVDKQNPAALSIYEGIHKFELTPLQMIWLAKNRGTDKYYIEGENLYLRTLSSKADLRDKAKIFAAKLSRNMTTGDAIKLLVDFEAVVTFGSQATVFPGYTTGEDKEVCPAVNNDEQFHIEYEDGYSWHLINSMKDLANIKNKVYNGNSLQVVIDALRATADALESELPAYQAVLDRVVSTPDSIADFFCPDSSGKIDNTNRIWHTFIDTCLEDDERCSTLMLFAGGNRQNLRLPVLRDIGAMASQYMSIKTQYPGFGAEVKKYI